jgi:hypothetical protein
MGERGINIIGMDSSTTLQGEYHISRTALDCRAYACGRDGTHDERRVNPEARLTQLGEDLALEFIGELRFFEPAFACVAIERDLSLWSLYKAATDSAGSLYPARVSVKNGFFEIPDEEVELIRRKCRPAVVDTNSVPQVLVALDAESNLLRLAIFFEDHGIVPITLTFDNRPGAIAALTKSLCDNGCNVLASRFVSVDEERMLAWLLLEQLGGGSRRKKDDGMVVGRIRDFLMADNEFHGFEPKVITE